MRTFVSPMIAEALVNNVWYGDRRIDFSRDSLCLNEVGRLFVRNLGYVGIAGNI